MDDKHKDPWKDHPWEKEYASERSNSPNGVLVEIRLYGQNDRSTWLVSRIYESLSKGTAIDDGGWKTMKQNKTKQNGNGKRDE
jgi:hypothetical protein